MIKTTERKINARQLKDDGHCLFSDKDYIIFDFRSVDNGQNYIIRTKK